MKEKLLNWQITLMWLDVKIFQLHGTLGEKL